jgi:FimV-like protein
LNNAFNGTTDPFQRTESAFFLAKAHLMKADVDSARHWLGQVLEQQVADYRDEATQLLNRLDGR